MLLVEQTTTKEQLYFYKYNKYVVILINLL